MDLVPCNEAARQRLADLIFGKDGLLDMKEKKYAVKNFPDILADVSRHGIEQATRDARSSSDNSMVRHQLRPFLKLVDLLGKAPQVEGLMYHYYENSGFQPLPEKLFEISDSDKRVVYKLAGFDDALLLEILVALSKYLAFNRSWFSSVWNWTELAHLVDEHTDPAIRYVAASCLSIITRPTRLQHISILRDVLSNLNERDFIDLQTKFCQLFHNSFRPGIETRATKRAREFTASVGKSDHGYDYCKDSLARISNILMLKRDNSIESNENEYSNKKSILRKYITAKSLDDTLSQIAYCISIGKPCLLRGPSGSGKTAILDYIAAQTNRVGPPDYLFVQVGDQIDSKQLIGTYICTEIPGQFEWQPGPLTRAMCYGSWIVFEDIDTAPSDMMQVIHSVIENGNLTCVSSCPMRLDSPHPDFRILFTQRTADDSRSNNLQVGLGFIEKLCNIVVMPNLSREDLKHIIEKRYNLSHLSDTILDMYDVAEPAMRQQGAVSRRALNNRDLFRVCDILYEQNVKATGGKFSSKDLDLVLADVISCWLSSLTKAELCSVCEQIGGKLSISADKIRHLVYNRTPEIAETSDRHVIFGNISLRVRSNSDAQKGPRYMAPTKPALQIIEKVALCIKHNQPVLLVGETGVGKTHIVQYIARLIRNELIVINLSQQSDSSDLLGGFKPVKLYDIMQPILSEFTHLCLKSYKESDIIKDMRHANDLCVSLGKQSSYILFLTFISKICQQATNLPDNLMLSWNNLNHRCRKLMKRIKDQQFTMALGYSQGTLMRAMTLGHWVLLDEVNLAEPEVLQCLVLILDALPRRRIYMFNGTDMQFINIHEGFRVFACMNPSTDVGKKDLNIGIRARFIELYVDEITDKRDLRLIVQTYIGSSLSVTRVDQLVSFYLTVKERAKSYNDISGNSPIFSLRSLCRALMICMDNACHNMEKSLFEALQISFLQQLNQSSKVEVMKLIEQCIFDKTTLTALSKTPIPRPVTNHNDVYRTAFIQIEGYWVEESEDLKVEDPSYILTNTVHSNLKSIVRVLSLGGRRLPILIQGNTSTGKTSLIKYLADKTGNRLYRINNHEHTDLQEYIGQYQMSSKGELVWRDGLLVRAMRKGYWIIFDELNLAPCELLEALNRVLDDNRELFIPETGETVRAHSKFMLFATQNPPGEYAGRKMLSRAFRNRFIELHFDEFPDVELEEILCKRCEMPPQYAKKIVDVMKALRMHRRESGFFNGKHGFMTLRDLFRWGNRYLKNKFLIPDGQFYDWEDFIASEGLVLLEGRVRTMNEAEVVRTTLNKVFKKVIDPDHVYNKKIYSIVNLSRQVNHIHFSKEFQRMFSQLYRALKFKEPVLLCGPTGCGKTTACQLYAEMKERSLITYNCHLNTESSDFLGSLRPIRSDNTSGKEQRLFEWVDGPLLTAMKTGAIFLLDEISLADDAVLERINSILESERKVTLTEFDGSEVIAHNNFCVVATMNPGGDYGKKELSPALRNRFTEIFCHSTTDLNEVREIIERSIDLHLELTRNKSKLVGSMISFLKVYQTRYDMVSIRDVLNWTKFINKVTQRSMTQVKPMSLQDAIMHGAALIFFDQFGTCGHKSIMLDGRPDAGWLRARLRRIIAKIVGRTAVYAVPDADQLVVVHDIVQVRKYYLLKGPERLYDSVFKEFILNTPIVKKNILKIVRAMQLDRPILLEGDPGAGKTSVVSALAKLTGHKLVRINLSEQTDISDLFGCDLPETKSRSEAPSFRWHDGPMLTAIRKSHWILLDEMNLASQSVLEGLNACFDHRGEIYIAEINRKFSVDRSKSRVFACQNPYLQGAARKGLPQSFLNRFTSIYIESHTEQDLCNIVQQRFPQFPSLFVQKLVKFNNIVKSHPLLASFEFNLRDILYWCELMTKYPPKSTKTLSAIHDETLDAADVLDKCNSLFMPAKTVQFVYLDRIRADNSTRDFVVQQFEDMFDTLLYEPAVRDLKLGEHSFLMGRSILPRKLRLHPHLSQYCLLKYQMPYIESMARAIEFKKMLILVGDTGVGKRSMTKILAGLTGNELKVLGANRDMDTIELLGSFEQKSFQREVVEVVEQAKRLLTSTINNATLKYYASPQILRDIWVTLFMTSPTHRDTRLSQVELLDAYRVQLNNILRLLKKDSSTTSKEDIERVALIARIDLLIKKLVYYCDSVYSQGNFEWIDSVLVDAIRDGSWLIIENANLMNPAVLDRLNSLVEPNGTISLNEKGAGSDGVEVLKPHPDFRLILTMNPTYGELSRAMRNRGVEIYVQTSFFFEDFLILLNQNGFEIPEEDHPCMTYCVMQTCCDVHKLLTGKDPADEGGLLTHFGLNYLPLLAHECRRNALIVDQILADLMSSYYRHRNYRFEDAITRKANQDNDDLSNVESIQEYIQRQMDAYRKEFVVTKGDERYKWMNFQYDLVALSGGDALPAMVERDSKLFDDEFNIESLIKPEELIENIDIVNSCIHVRIFLELSTYGDFEYREGFIRHTFANHPKMLDIVSAHLELLRTEYIPLIEILMPQTNLIPISDVHVDSRNGPDVHDYLCAIDADAAKKRNSYENRWLLSLHRIMLQMIIELSEERSLSMEGKTSLWSLSEAVRERRMYKEYLIRPAAEIASDLYELLNGLLGVVTNRCFDDDQATKMMPRLFWLNYIRYKLRMNRSNDELIELCNQLPMLWALTYNKVVRPVSIDCDLADCSYNDKKFSQRIQQICDFLDLPQIQDAEEDEKSRYKRIVNLQATTTKRSDTLDREMDRFSANLYARYCTRTKVSLSNKHKEVNETLATSSLVWSSSVYFTAFYDIMDKIIQVEAAEMDVEPYFRLREVYDQIFEDACEMLKNATAHYQNHELWLEEEMYVRRLMVVNRRQTTLDQLAPVWQVQFLHKDLARLAHRLLANDIQQREIENHKSILQQKLRCIHGIVFSPRMYLTMMKTFNKVLKRSSEQDDSDHAPGKIERQNLELYTLFLVDKLLETSVLDTQIVGWTKLRVETSELSVQAPIISEYSPIISLVSSYCLSIPSLKLRSYSKSNAQLDALRVFLWMNYASSKADKDYGSDDTTLAQNLIDFRNTYRNAITPASVLEETEPRETIEDVLRREYPIYDELQATIKENLDNQSDIESFTNAIKLIYYGSHNYTSYAPLFSFDPALKSREKLEVYRSELTHIKLDLQFRNTLYYWKTGENLALNDIDDEKAEEYPFSTKVLVQRRNKLEKSVVRLQREYTNRPKSDDGCLYHELHRDVKVNRERYDKNIGVIVEEFVELLKCKDVKTRPRKFSSLVSKIRMVIRSLERTICRTRTEFSLYRDLTTNYLVGLCFAHQGLRCMYARLEQWFQIQAFGYRSLEQFWHDIYRVFSFNNYLQGNFASVQSKLDFYPRLDKLCHPDDVKQIQSILLLTVMKQLNHHVLVTPSDIEACIPIVHRIADLFNQAWLRRKQFLEEQREQLEKQFQYKPITTTLGGDEFSDRKEFIEVCSKFPTYDGCYEGIITTERPLDEIQNLKTENNITRLNCSVDLSMCIDICKAHYKFMMSASRNLLGYSSFSTQTEDSKLLPEIDLTETIQLEAQALYAIIRHCIVALDQSFDSITLECHMLQAKQLSDMLSHPKEFSKPSNRIQSSLDILDEDVFDIYHCGMPHEALKFNELIARIDAKVNKLRNTPERGYEQDPHLHKIEKLNARISSFLITDPLMKFVTGSHALAEKMRDWNQSSTVVKDDKMIAELDDLCDLIKSWRSIECASWKGSLHNVKRKYIHDTICDLWFELYDAFRDPLGCAQQVIKHTSEPESGHKLLEDELVFYATFGLYIKYFIENCTLGDYQIRLDLVHAFTIQTRFAGASHTAKPWPEEAKFKINYDKLTHFVYNVYRQYCGLFKQVTGIVEKEEAALICELNSEIKVISWLGRSLWEIKNNFRNSHKKLNKIMNKYLEVLRRKLPNLSIEVSTNTKVSSDASPLPELGASCGEKIEMTLMTIHMLIDQIVPPASLNELPCKIVARLPKLISKMQSINQLTRSQLSPRFVAMLNQIESSMISNKETINNFRSHKVHEVILRSRDTQEIKENKLKLCRQMHHSKKYSIQSIFKSLQNLGVSYQRGLNNRHVINRDILSMEPLRGMIRRQSRSVLKAANQLVSEAIIESCNVDYMKLVTLYMVLCNTFIEPSEDLTFDQAQRIRGLSHDLLIDVLNHSQSAATIYRHLIDVQAVTTRLMNLRTQKSTTSGITILNFSRTHKVISQFNELVGRAHLAALKLDKLADCYCPLSKLDETADSTLSPLLSPAQQKSERAMLRELIDTIDEDQSLMTDAQYNCFKSNIQNVLKNLSEVSDELRDSLINTNKNYLYSKDDIERMQALYAKFYTTFSEILPATGEQSINCQETTPLASIKSILHEAKSVIEPHLALEYIQAVSPTEDDCKVWDCKLDVRLSKLVREIKLSVQAIKSYEAKELENAKINTEAMRRQMKPFNYLNSRQICSVLRSEHVSKCLSDFLMTINRCKPPLAADDLVDGLGPVLFLYTQNVAAYLNIILASVQLKIGSSLELFDFFKDVMFKGFGLPMKLSEMNESNGNAQPTQDGQSEDNVGFGEGQGDRDVSKKLEYESQLDELKKDDADGKQEDEEEPVKAHDDGVEMSEDIDGKATGADQDDDTARKDDENGNEEDNKEDEEALNDLDRVMDTVDQEETELDEKLWSDIEDPVEDDDQQDLRDAENDVKSSVQSDSKELSAKDDFLTEMEDVEPKKEESQDLAAKQDDEPAADKPQEAKDPSLEMPEVDMDDAERLDLDEDAALAEKEHKLQEDTSNAEKENPDDIDMSVDNETAEPDVDKVDDDQKAEDGAEEGDTVVDEPAEEQQAEDATETGQDREEGEIADDDKDSSQSSDALNDSLDDETVHAKLQNALEAKDSLAESVEDTKRNQSAATKERGQSNDGANDSTSTMIKGKKVGAHNLYDVFEQFEGPDEDNIGDEEDFERSFDKDKTSGANDASTDKADLDETEQAQNGKGDESTGAEKESLTESESVTSKTSKRTLAEREDEVLSEEALKRQKILDAAERAEASDKLDEDEGEDQKQKSAQTADGVVRHLDTDKKDAITVVDIASDDEQQQPLEEKVPEGGADNASLSLNKATGDNEPDNKSSSDQLDKKQLATVIDLTLSEDSADDDMRADEGKEATKEVDDDSLSSISSDIIEQLAAVDDAVSKATEPDMHELSTSVRDLRSTYNTNFGMLKYISNIQQGASADNVANDDWVKQIDAELDQQQQQQQRTSIGAGGDNNEQQQQQQHGDADKLMLLWRSCTRDTQQLCGELCQQLQIVLQPTKMSKYRGDYKTGKRLNMRKIITYIASHYRRDKIWLRRTKPAKRTYNICLAVDNSSSMAENNCRLMTYQSLALLAKSLTDIEAGSMSVLKFGEHVNCVLDFDQPYGEALGAHLLRALRFNEKRTSYSKLLQHACKMFKRQALATHAGGSEQGAVSVRQLLIILSDGRNMGSEENEIRVALKDLKQLGVLSLFVIIDDLARNKGTSIVDVKSCLQIGGGIQMSNYMDRFPFPFYLLLRELKAMPSVLGEALRQWFELMASGGRE